MKYLIIGAGGTGGCIGAYMTEAGKDVTMIARGAHLAAMQSDGLYMETTKRGNYTVKPVKAVDMASYKEKPDIIFVCVKGYSLEDTVPFIRQVAKPETVVVPILNIYGTGERLQRELPELLVTDGCIYIAAQIKKPGHLWQNGDIFRVVFGVREPSEYRPVLKTVKKDLEDSGIACVLSDNIRRDALQKFSYVSPAAACGQYYNAKAGDMQKPGVVRDTFAALIGEIDSLARAMGISFQEDIVKTNLAILDDLTPEASTSMQRDIGQGKQSEIDGLIFEVVRMGKKYQINLPVYERIAAQLEKEGVAAGNGAVLGKVQIRPMVPDDYSKVYALWMGCTGMGLNSVDDSEEGIRRFLQRNPDTCFIAVDKEKAVGAIMAGNDGRRGYIYHTSVDTAYRRQGIGRKLVDAALGALKNIGITKAALVAFERNEPGNAFWEKQGFSKREDLAYRDKALADMVRIDT